MADPDTTQPTQPDSQVESPAPPDTPAAPESSAEAAPAKKTAAKKATKKSAAKKATKKSAATKSPDAGDDVTDATPSAGDEAAPAPRKRAAAKKSTTKKSAAKKAAPGAAESLDSAGTAAVDPATATAASAAAAATLEPGADESGVAVLFQAPVATPRKRTRKTAAAPVAPVEPADEVETVGEEDDEDPTIAAALDDAATDSSVDAAIDPAIESAPADSAEEDDSDDDDSDDSDDSATDDGSDDGAPRRRRRRGGRRRRRGGGGGAGDGEDSAGSDDGADRAPAPKADATGGDSRAGDTQETGDADDTDGAESGAESGEGSSRRRRRRSRDRDSSGESESTGGGSSGGTDRGSGRARRTRNPEDEITAVSGSTRLEAKKQRRREGREAGRRRAPIVSEAEFLARREAVDRVMAVRQRDDVTQIAVLEDKVLVEHYVARESQTSLIGNVYLGRVQNVLPSMEAAFIDIGKGRNAVLYAGEVNWSALGHKDGQGRKIESVLSSGQTILVQVTKDPMGHKGARLTSQVSLAGRFLVYVPDGTTSGISRKLPDTERHRLKTLLKEIVPDTAGVIVRTAAEGASEEELTSDVERLKARWEQIEAAASGKASSPQLLYGEPDLTLKVVRDLFTEDFARLVIQGDDAWNLVSDYVADVAPDLAERLERFDPSEHQHVDLFARYRVDEQIAKGLDRKVFLPSGGSLVIDRTEAMTVVDVNTGKFTGSGGNLEETVTKNNLEAAEEIVRQLRLRDIGGIIVVDFIDMVLESNRDLVVRRLVECLGRDRTRHQVAEVTSLGLVQMTRKKIGTGLLEAFSETCEHCHGRGVMLRELPVAESAPPEEDGRRSGRRRGRGRGGDDEGDHTPQGGRSDDAAASSRRPTPADFAAMAAHAAAEAHESAPVDDQPAEPVAAPAAVSAEEAAPPVVSPAPSPVVTTTRSSRRRSSVTVQTPVLAEPDAVDDVEPEPEAAQPTPPAVEPEVAAAPPARAAGTTSVVTTTRRRGASRGAVTAGTAAALSASAAPAPVTAGPVVAAAAPPKVTTRSRGTRAARATEPAPTQPEPEPEPETD